MKIDSSEPTNPVACEPGGEPPPPPPARTNAEKFWAALTAKQTFELLVVAPKKVAGPWNAEGARRTAEGKFVVQKDAQCGFAICPPDGHTFFNPFFDTAAEADAALRRLGWILVD